MSDRAKLVSPRSISLSAMMFLEFFIWGAWYVTMGPFLEAKGMADSIPDAYSLAPIAAIISPFFLGLVADRFFATERVLAIMQLLAGAVMLAAPAAAEHSSQAFLAVIFIHTLLFMPTLGLTNTLAFHNMENPEKQFPLVRVLGTIGWIVAGWVISAINADAGPGMFYLTGGAALAMGVYSFFLPHTPPPAKGEKPTVRDLLGLESLSLLKQRPFFIFILCSFLICIPLAGYYNWAGVFTGSLGVKDVGRTMSFGQVSEIVFMLALPLCFMRLGVKWMLAVGMFAWVLRYVLFAGAESQSSMAMLYAGILLHGICYDFFFVTGQIYVDKKAPARIRGQAQGFLVLITQGLGMLIGARLFGILAEANKGVRADKTVFFDWTPIWLVPAGFALLVLIVFVLFFRDRVDRAIGSADAVTPHAEGAGMETAV